VSAKEPFERTLAAIIVRMSESFGSRPQPLSVNASLDAPTSRFEQRIQVEFTYPVVFTEHVLDPANTTLAWAVSHRESNRRHRCLAVADAGLVAAWPSLAQQLTEYAQHYEGILSLVGNLQLVPGGESAKNDPSVIERLQAEFGEQKLDRQSIVLALGGGAVLDAIGFAAATTHRGIRIVRLPTTVLAQNDAGIGVKNGVNGRGAKNYLGTFAAPFAVLCDRAWLTTLADRDRRSGIAEAIKVALIRDRTFFEWLETHARALAEFAIDETSEMIRRCAELHLRHIRTSGDPFEMGSVRPLDFGHWAAHKLENMTSHALRHGEAVAIGIALDATYSAASGLLPLDSAHRILDLLTKLGLPTWHESMALRKYGELLLLSGLEEFREHLGGELALTLLSQIGRGVEVLHVDKSLMDRCVTERVAYGSVAKTSNLPF